MIRLLFLVASMIGFSAQAGLAATFNLVPHDQRPGGQPVSDSVKQLTQWGFSFDNATDGGNPVTDVTGSFQNRKQTFPVFMLGGTVSTGIKRTFQAPRNKLIAIPIFGGTCLGSDAVGTCVGDDTIKDYIDSTKRLFLSIDGEVIINAKGRHAVDRIGSKYRVNTGIFSVNLAPNNWASEVYNLPDLLKGEFPESYADGFYAFAQLADGPHDIIYSGKGFSEALGGLVKNRVTAKVNVVPVPPALVLLVTAFASLGLATRRRRMTG